MLVMQQILAFCVFLVCAGGLYMILQSEGFEQLKLVVLFRFTGLQESSDFEYSDPVEAAPLKAIDFLEAGVEARVVIIGPINGSVRRLLLLWRGNKYRCIVMNSVRDISIENCAGLYDSTVIEAREITARVFQKRKPKSERGETEHEARSESPQPVVQPAKKPPAEAKVEVKPTAKPVANSKPAENAIPEPQKQGEDEPTLMGFESMVCGVLVSAQPETHVKSGQNGKTEEFRSFTVKLNTNDGLEHLIGNDLRRAIEDAKAVAGDTLKVFHMRNIQLPSGHYRKKFQVLNVTRPKLNIKNEGTAVAVS